MSEFPAASFRIDGDASAISGSAGKWKAFAGQATDASGQITSLDTSLFVGPEGDSYRDGLNKDMPPHLKVTGDAYGKVSAALSTFSSSLSGLQEKMQPLASKAPGLWQAVQGAQSAYDQAKTDDANHAKSRSAAEKALKPGDDPLPADTYQAKSGGASSSLSSAQKEWNDCLSSANGLKSDLSSAVDTCVKAIDHAKGMRFKENPGFWDIGGHIKNFISEHKDFLKKLSGVLKVVSAVAGVLSFIPVLAPILGPVALITGAAAFAIDVGIYAATGEGSLKSLIIDGALMLLPGVGKLATLARGAKGVKAASSVAKMQKFGIANRVVVKSGDAKFSQWLPRGSKLYTGAGGAPAKVGAKMRLRELDRSTKPWAYQGVRVSKSVSQNKLAAKTVQRLQKAGAKQIRVDQAQVNAAGQKLGRTRPDVQASVGEQRVNFEYDKPPYDRVDKHITDTLNHDPGSIVITVPKK